MQPRGSFIAFVSVPDNTTLCPETCRQEANHTEGLRQVAEWSTEVNNKILQVFTSNKSRFLSSGKLSRQKTGPTTDWTAWKLWFSFILRVFTAAEEIKAGNLQPRKAGSCQKHRNQRSFSSPDFLKWVKSENWWKMFRRQCFYFYVWTLNLLLIFRNICSCLLSVMKLKTVTSVLASNLFSLFIQQILFWLIHKFTV